MHYVKFTHLAGKIKYHEDCKYNTGKLTILTKYSV